MQSQIGKKVGAKEISAHVNAPEPFTAKILQELVRRKMIGSQKGPTGGFYAGDEHASFTLKDLVVVIDGDELFSGCSLGLKQCSETNPCPLHHQVVRLRKGMVEMLTEKSLKELAAEVESGATVLSRMD